MTVYAHIGQLSSFYEWLMQEPQLAEQIHHNPVRLVRLKVPKSSGHTRPCHDLGLPQRIVVKRDHISSALVARLELEQ